MEAFELQQVEMLRKISEVPLETEESLRHFQSILALGLGRSHNYITLTHAETREAVFTDPEHFGQTELIASRLLNRYANHDEFVEVLNPSQDFRFKLVAAANDLPEIRYFSSTPIRVNDRVIGHVNLVDEIDRGPLGRTEQKLLLAITAVIATNIRTASHARFGLLSVPVLDSGA